jgi:hypothetical protein
MTFSWKELVCHGLLVEIGEPSLVKDLLKMVMKERWLFLEEEARVFHSENVAAAPDPAAGWRQLERQYSELRHQINTAIATKLPPQLLQKCLETDAAISRRKLMDELLSSWKERIPEKRRRAVMSNKETCLRAKHNARTSIIWTMAELRQKYPSITESINWYGEIHEGRYYLFWDKKIANAIADCAKRRRQQISFLMSGFDINIIDGERKSWVRRPSDTWIYAYEQWTKNPGGWGVRQSEFTMVHSIGKKEKMHIDDMFH